MSSKRKDVGLICILASIREFARENNELQTVEYIDGLIKKEKSK